MAKVIAIANLKGGVGKTSTALALAGGLLQRGQRVLVVDLDGQENISYIMRADMEALTVYDVLTGKATAAEATQHTEQGDIIPATVKLVLADINITGNGCKMRLRAAIEPIKGSYDYIIIDTPPSLGVLTQNALTAADGLIIPLTADILSLKGVEQMGAAVEAIRLQGNPALQIYGLLLTRFNARAVLNRHVVEAAGYLARTLQTRLFETYIRDGIAIREAQANRKSMYTTKSKPAADYNAFVSEFLTAERGQGNE